MQDSCSWYSQRALTSPIPMESYGLYTISCSPSLRHHARNVLVGNQEHLPCSQNRHIVHKASCILILVHWNVADVSIIEQMKKHGKWAALAYPISDHYEFGDIVIKTHLCEVIHEHHVNQSHIPSCTPCYLRLWISHSCTMLGPVQLH